MDERDRFLYYDQIQCEKVSKKSDSVPEIGEQWDADLMDMQSMPKRMMVFATFGGDRHFLISVDSSLRSPKRRKISLLLLKTYYALQNSQSRDRWRIWI